MPLQGGLTISIQKNSVDIAHLVIYTEWLYHNRSLSAYRHPSFLSSPPLARCHAMRGRGESSFIATTALLLTLNYRAKTPF
jgi:hypothetical protein